VVWVCVLYAQRYIRAAVLLSVAFAPSLTCDWAERHTVCGTWPIYQCVLSGPPLQMVHAAWLALGRGEETGLQ
jgi:hypothetical protein